jgi:hypothetical protein
MQVQQVQQSRAPNGPLHAATPHPQPCHAMPTPTPITPTARPSSPEVAALLEKSGSGLSMSHSRLVSEKATVMPPPVSGCRMLKASPSMSAPAGCSGWLVTCLFCMHRMRPCLTAASKAVRRQSGTCRDAEGRSVLNGDEAGSRCWQVTDYQPATVVAALPGRLQPAPGTRPFPCSTNSVTAPPQSPTWGATLSSRYFSSSPPVTEGSFSPG